MNLTDDEMRVKAATLMGYYGIERYQDGALIGSQRLQGRSEVPDYPNDPAAALTLCDRLREEGWRVDISRGTLTDWWVSFTRFDDAENALHRVTDPSPARAICLAFLKVKGDAK